MTDLNSCVVHELARDGEFLISRAQSADGIKSWLMTSLVEDLWDTGAAKLRHAYMLRDDLGISYAAKPLEITEYQGRPALLAEDPQGLLLSKLLGAPLPVSQFLALAIGIVTALGELHSRGLVHRDIKPTNLVVDPLTGAARLTGFGITSRPSRLHPSTESPEALAGTLAYMSPEQTGRTARLVDTRSDLYSLGMTLYEMLVGAPAFAAADAMEWVHCHIARSPEPPSARYAQVPEQLSAVVMKLLAKTPEDRYQSAGGLVFDLRRSMSAWDQTGQIPPFALGERDVPGRLSIQGKLYGREHEVNALVAAMARVVAQGRAELVLVSGYSGVGKTSIVNELRKTLVYPRALFAAGKFDQYKRDIPYSTLAQAFQDLLRQILGGSEEELSVWRDGLQEALGANARLITDLVPELKFILGEPPPLVELPAQDAQRRFQYIFRRFVAVLAQPQHPLALFLDDLQWLDAATLDLIEDLLTHPDTGHLLLIGAYRNNEVSGSHPLSRKLESIRQMGAPVSLVTLRPLSHGDLAHLIGDALHREAVEASPLADVIHEKTAGNPYFAIQFVTSLAEESLISYDHLKARWSWNADGIRAKQYTDNVVDLMVGKLGRLPAATRHALQQLACFGSTAETAMLSHVAGTTEEKLHEAMRQAVQLNLAERSGTGYRFSHDRVQEAAYLLIPEASRPEMHVRIGRVHLAQTPLEKREEMVFEIVNQLNRGVSLLTTVEERAELAELNLIAGKRAKESTAYASAILYLVQGVQLLDNNCPTAKHETLFALERHLAECEFLTGVLDAADARLKALSTRAANTVELAIVTSLRIDLYTTLDRSDQAVAVGLDYLRHLGIDWSPHPARTEVELEYTRFSTLLGGRTIEDLIDLPLMSDAASLGTMDVLSNIMAPALFTDQNLFALVTCRAVNLSLEQGNCHGSCFVYLWMGPSFDNYQEGFRFAKLSLDLVDTRGLDRFKPRVYLHFGNIVNHWRRPFHAGREWIQRGFEAANETGDLTFVAYGCNHMVANLIASGEALADLQMEAETRLDFARNSRFGLVVDIITAQRQLVRALRGRTVDLASFDDSEFGERHFEHHLESDTRLAIATCWYWIRKLQLGVYAGDFKSAASAAAKASPLLWTCPWHVEVAEYHFYAALALAGCLISPATERGEIVEALTGHHRMLAEWAANSPENFTNRVSLVAAEIARIEGRALDAEQLYERAIASARTHGFVHNAALCCEFASRFYAERGLETIAHAYIRDAHHSYLRWGADGKVKQLEEVHPRLRDDRVPSWVGTLKAPIEDLDLLSLAKSAEAISQEIVLDKLVGMLLGIAIESAGADKGTLVLIDERGPTIEAQAFVREGKVNVKNVDAVATSAYLPMSILQFSIRTRQCLILDDATERNAYSGDDYVQRQRPRSVLCLPIVKQTKLMGVLYLENTLAPRVFTVSRVSMLNLLASRAAISLENAKLYADLERENTVRRRAEEELRRSEQLMSEGQRIGGTGSWAWNVQTGRLLWSKEQKHIFGFSPAAQELSLDDFIASIHPDDRASAIATVTGGAKAGRPFDHEFRIVLPDGSVKFIRGSGRPVFDSTNTVVEYFGAVLDITEQQKTDSELQAALSRTKESEERYRAFVDKIPCHAWTADAVGDAEFFSRRLLEYTGLTSQEAQGDCWANIIHPEDAKLMGEAWQQMVSSNSSCELEARIRRHDGRYLWHLLRSTPVLRPDGKAVRWYGTGVDIDDLKRAETLLAGEKRLFEMIATGESLGATLRALCEIVEDLADGSLVSILLMDENGKRLRHCASPSLPASFTDAIDGSLIGPTQGSCGAAAYRGEKVYVSDIATDPLWVDFRDLALAHGLRACWSSPILSSDRSVLGTFALYSREARTITSEEVRITDQFAHLARIVVERKRAEDALRKSEAFLAEAQRIAHVGYWERDLESNVLTWSDESYRIFGLPKDGRGVHSSQHAELIHPDDRERVTQEIQRALAGAARWDSEYRIVRPDGEIRVVHSMGDNVVEEGSSRRRFGTVQDITERKQTEDDLRRSEADLRKVQADLAHVTRVTTMGELAASIVHEVSQPLTGIVTSAGVSLRWLSAETPNLSEARAAIQRVVRDGNRAGEVIARIRKLFRKETTPKEPLDINEVIREVVVLIQGELQRQCIVLHLGLTTNLPTVFGDRVQLQQVLMNLGLNAIEALGSLVSGPRDLRIATRCDDRDKVCVEVRDTGPGIHPEAAEHIFDPFHTSKPGGMGMGLPICRTIVEDHGGRLRLVPQTEPGARFEFTLMTGG